MFLKMYTNLTILLFSIFIFEENKMYFYSEDDMRISKEEDLQAKFQSQEQVMLYGDLSLVRIILRYMQKNNLSDKVTGVSLSKSKKMLFQVLGYKLQSIRSLSHKKQEALILILENS